jgi:DNA-binding NtrC family response regulator
MKPSDMRILIVAEDGPEAAELISNIVMNVDAEIGHVGTLADAREAASENLYDAVVAMQNLPDGMGVELLAEPGPIEAPVILIEDEMVSSRLVSALRHGAADVLPVPVDFDYLVHCIRRIVQQHRAGIQEAIRAKRLRRLSSKLVKDRREMRKRVDLICTDIVTAYQRLAEKVVGVLEPGDEGADEGDSFSLRGEE